MEVSSIIADVLKRLDMDKEYDLENISKVKDEVIDKIVISINSVITEIATDYIPCANCETLKVVNGKIPYDSFSKNVVEIKKMTKNGMAVKFSPQVEVVKAFCSDGDVEVEYHYSLLGLGQADSFKLSARVSQQLVVLGVLSDYLAMAGRVDESLMYDRRYREGLRLAMRDNKSRYLKVRSLY